MNDRELEQQILVQLGAMSSGLAHIRTDIAELKDELQRQREAQVSRAEHRALDDRVKGLEAMALQFVEFKATVRTAMGLGGSGVVAGVISTAMHFLS